MFQRGIKILDADGSLTPNNFSRALAVQLRCIHAIIIRDIMMRFGRNNIGFLWLVLEPMLLCSLVMVLWYAIDPPYTQSGIGVVSFVFTGYMPLTLWRHMSIACINMSRRSSGLLWHRNITILDAIVARLVMEFLGTTAALFVIYLVLLSAGVVDPPVNPGLALIGWLQMGLLAGATGVALAALTEWSETAERFIQPVQYILIPISGYLIMVAWLPAYAQKMVLWNPLIHIYEMYRAGFFGPSIETHYTMWYPALTSLIFLTVGLWGMEKMRDRMHFS